MFRTFAGYGCSEGEYNDLAVLAFNPQGFKIQALFASPHGTFHVSSLLLYSAFYYLLAALTYGAFIPSGLFTVSLIFGGCFGRIWAEVLLRLGLIDASQPGLVGMYALLGAGDPCAGSGGRRDTWVRWHVRERARLEAGLPADHLCCAVLCCCRCSPASFLGGLMRMSASMCLILMEMTGACVRRRDSNGKRVAGTCSTHTHTRTPVAPQRLRWHMPHKCRTHTTCWHPQATPPRCPSS
jgi:hypothetical protein